jgi:hypothetical protein
MPSCEHDIRSAHTQMKSGGLSAAAESNVVLLIAI